MIINPNHKKFQFLADELIKLSGIVELDYIDDQQVRVTFNSNATAQQRQAVNNYIASFNWSDLAQAVREQAKAQDRDDLRNSAQQAIQDIDAFLAIASPSNAQILQAVRRLAQIDKQLIKRLIQID